MGKKYFKYKNIFKVICVHKHSPEVTLKNWFIKIKNKKIQINVKPQVINILSIKIFSKLYVYISTALKLH